MASERIGYDDIFDKDALPTLLKQFAEAQIALDNIQKKMSSIVTESTKLAQSQGQSFGNAKEIKATEQAINDVLNATEELNKVEKSREDLEKRMSKLIGDRAKFIEDLEVEVVKLKEAQKKLRKEEKEGLKTAEEAARERSRLQNEIKLTQKAILEERKALIDATKATEENTRSLTRAEKLRMQLKELTTAQAQEEAVLAERLRQQRKALRDAAKEALNNRDAYQELTKQTNEAQKRFKRLAAEFGANSKQAKEAREEFLRLDDQLRDINDAAKDGRRDVGRYRIAVDKLGDSIGKIGAATGVVAVLSKVFEGFQAVLGNNSEASSLLEKGLGRITVTFTVLLGRITKALPALGALFTSVFGDISNSIKGAILDLKILAAESFNVFGTNKEQVAALKAELAELNKETSSTSEAWEELTSVFEGTGDEIAETIDKNDRLIDTTLAYRREILSLKKAQDSLLSQQAALQAAADNDNNSLLERIQFQKQLIDQTSEIDRLALKQAKRQEDLAIQNASIFNASLDAQEAAQAATSERIALEIEQEAERLAQKTELATLERDLVEQNLDFLIDNFDNQKTINERLVADETKSFEERQALIEKNRQLAAESFEAQIDLFNERAKKQGKAQLDLEALVMESDSRIIAEQAKNAGISVALLTRVLEVIRERRTVTQDNAEAQRDLNTQLEEANILEQETALNLETVNKLKEEGVDVEGVLQKLEEKGLEKRIENLKRSISLLDENSIERIRKEKELSELLLEEQGRRLEKEAEAEAKAAQRRVEIQEAAFSTVEKFADNLTEKRISQIDELLAAEQKREDELRDLAERGIQDANENLAENQKRQAELERQREDALRRQRAFELALAAARAYSANVAAGEPNPLGKTITDITLLESFIDVLTGFKEGTEDTGTTGAFRDKDGVITGYTHEKERVMTKEQNLALPQGVNNWELVRLAHMGKAMEARSDAPQMALASNLREVVKAIENKPAYLGRDYDHTRNAVVEYTKQQNKMVRRHMSNQGGLISKRRK